MLDLDMIIASPCNALNIMAVSPSDANKKQASESIVKEPSRFEMDQNEHQMWETLKEAHRQQFQPGTRLKSLNDVCSLNSSKHVYKFQMSFVSKSLEQNLQLVARSKVVDEAIEIRKQREMDRLSGKDNSEDGPQIVMMIGNGVGMFQIISSRFRNNWILMFLLFRQ